MTIKVRDNFLIVGDKQYAIEKKLVKKLDRVVRGVTQESPKEDALLINEGKERKGKTNASVVEAAYFKAQTGRDVHLFFRLEPMIEFAKSTKNKIIIYDEPSLDSLTGDQLNSMNKDMQRLFMTVGKNRHIFIINYTKFWKFLEYIVVDRANGMIKMSDKEVGRFFYIRQKRLEFLWNEFRTKHKRAYKQAASFGGAMPNFMSREFSNLGFHVEDKQNATLEDYEEQKDKAIMSIGDKKSSKVKEKEEKYEQIIINIASSAMTWPQKAAMTGMSSRRLQEILAEKKSKQALMEGRIGLEA